MKPFDALDGDIKVIPVPDVAAIAATKKDKDWYGIFYDDETMDQDLQEGLPVHLKLNDADILVLFKETRDGRFFKSARFFRSHVPIDSENIVPIGDHWQVSKVLDGTIKDAESRN